MTSVAIIIRTYNEGNYLELVIKSILNQKIHDAEITIVIVDSGSIDNTLEIAKKYNTKLIQIDKNEFTYGYALNIGLSNVINIADIGISLSTHCIPRGRFWLKNLIEPIITGNSLLSFGSHVGGDHVRISEYNYFKYQYHKLKKGRVSYANFNNGNSAFLMKIWKKYRFNEKLIAQEDIYFAKQVKDNEKFDVYYSPRAMVTHIHNDNNIKLLKRLYQILYVEYEFNIRKRCSIFRDITDIFTFTILDIKKAKVKGKIKRAFPGILKFRVIQLIAFVGAAFMTIIRGSTFDK